MPAPRLRDPAWAVLAGVVAGIVLAVIHRPRTGMLLIAGTLAVAAVARAVLKPRDAGSLAVRNKEIDVVTLLLFAAALATLATVSPLSK